MRILLHTKQKPHQEEIKPTTTSYIYRAMTLLPKPNVETPLVRYTGVAKLEHYIEHTKENINNHLPTVVKTTSSNLSATQRQAVKNLQTLKQVLTIKIPHKILGSS